MVVGRWKADTSRSIRPASTLERSRTSLIRGELVLGGSGDLLQIGHEPSAIEVGGLLL